MRSWLSGATTRTVHDGSRTTMTLFAGIAGNPS